MPKYEFTGETKVFPRHTLRRIRALVAVGKDVRPGDLGGWIESEDNLAQDGDAWVYDEAKVFGRALVRGSARVADRAQVCNAWVYQRAKVYGDALVCEQAKVYGDALVYGHAKMYGSAEASGNAEVFGDAEVCGNAWICGDAKVCGYADYSVFRNTWAPTRWPRWFTYTSSNKMWTAGGFHGTGEDLIKESYAKSVLSGKCYEAVVRAQEAVEKAREENGNQEAPRGK